MIWACEHYHLYLYGQPVTVLTDHLPLLGMINKPGAKLSARVERWVLRLQPYDVTLKYQKGADNPADYMSRHPDKSATSTRATKVAEDYVNFLADESKPLALVKEKIITETQSDKTLQSVIKAVKTGRWWTDTCRCETLLQCEERVVGNTRRYSSTRLSHLHPTISARSSCATRSPGTPRGHKDEITHP